MTTIIFWKVRKWSFNIQSHLFHQLVIFQQLLWGLIIRNIDSAEITNRQTFMLKDGQVHTCTQGSNRTTGKQLREHHHQKELSTLFNTSNGFPMVYNHNVHNYNIYKLTLPYWNTPHVAFICFSLLSPKRMLKSVHVSSNKPCSRRQYLQCGDLV